MNLNKNQIWVRRFLLANILISLLALSSCGKQEASIEEKSYVQQLQRCRVELDKSDKKPIIGGGYLDTSRFGFVGSSVRYEDGQCGTDMLELSFWWTGKEILPNSPQFIKRKQADIPKNWHLLHVTAKLGNQRKARECSENIDMPQCSGFKGAVSGGYTMTEWPAELTVKLKNYPGLELWLEMSPPNIRNQYDVDNFIMYEWRRTDGTPRHINCWGLSPNDELSKKQGLDPQSLALLTREELENIDFRGKLQYGAACQVDFESFSFKGGAGRVRTGTEALHEVPKALEALSQYLSDSIVKDE